MLDDLRKRDDGEIKRVGRDPGREEAIRQSLEGQSNRLVVYMISKLMEMQKTKFTLKMVRALEMLHAADVFICGEPQVRLYA